jgi:hypothetical protein
VTFSTPSTSGRGSPTECVGGAGSREPDGFELHGWASRAGAAACTDSMIFT